MTPSFPTRRSSALQRLHLGGRRRRGGLDVAGRGQRIALLRHDRNQLRVVVLAHAEDGGEQRLHVGRNLIGGILHLLAGGDEEGRGLQLQAIVLHHFIEADAIGDLILYLSGEVVAQERKSVV